MKKITIKFNLDELNALLKKASEQIEELQGTLREIDEFELKRIQE